MGAVKFWKSRGAHFSMFVWVFLGVISMAWSVPVAQHNSQGTQTSSSSGSASSESSSQSPMGFDTSAILALVGAQGTPVTGSTGGYGRRRRSAKESGIVKRQTQNYPGLVVGEKATEETSETSAPSAESSGSGYVLPKGKYGDLKKFLALAGAKPTPVESCGDSCSYGRRKRTTDYELSNVIPVDEVIVKEVIAEDVGKDTVPADAVKVNPHSNVGTQVQRGMAPEVFKKKFRGGGYGRKRRDATPVSPQSYYLSQKSVQLKEEQISQLAKKNKLNISQRQSS